MRKQIREIQENGYFISIADNGVFELYQIPNMHVRTDTEAVCLLSALSLDGLSWIQLDVPIRYWLPLHQSVELAKVRFAVTRIDEIKKES